MEGIIHMDETINSDRNRFFINRLHNRTDFFKIADAEIEKIDNGAYCLVAIDIEHFKLFNKWYGREKGDEFLNQFSEILYYLEEDKQGICGYFGGDNFAALMKYGSIELNRVQEDLNQCAMDIGKKIGFLPAYGIYQIKDKTLPSVSMYDMALLALAQVKGNFDNRFCIYNESMTDSVEEELRLISEVKSAMDRDQFTFFVQPKCNISNGKIVGAEALVRWAHPEKGIISPGYFIPVLEKNGFIGDLDRCVWEMVCKWIRKCIDMNYTPIPISINVSRLDVISMDVPEILMEITEKYNIDHSLLRVEITESACVETTDNKIQGTVKRIQNAGFTVLMDDFGSGYSSLNMLKSVMIDVIKIDMKFLDISEDETQKGIGILESVVNMSNSMGIPIIVEGVENKKQEDYLIGMGCHFAQGYYYYKPMPISEFEKLLMDRDNFDYKGVFVNQSEQVHIDELINIESFSESQFNNILGAVSFFDMYDGTINVTKVNDQYYNLLGTEVDYDITKARQLWDNIFYDERENILKLFRDAEENQIKGSVGKIDFLNYDGNVIVLNVKLFLLKNELGHKQFIGLYSKAEDDISLSLNDNLEGLSHLEIRGFDNEEIIKAEKLYGNLPCGFTILELCTNEDNKPVDIEVLYVNKELEELYNRESVKIKMLLKKNFGKDFDDILNKFYQTAYEGKGFVHEMLNKETGRYLKNIFFQYGYGYIGIFSTDISKEHIFESIIQVDRMKDSKFYYVDLMNNTYSIIYPDNVNLHKYGVYSETIKKQIAEAEILDIEKDELNNFLSINGIRETLINKEYVEITYRYKNSKNYYEWCTIGIVANEREKNILKNVLVRIDRYNKKTLNKIAPNMNSGIVMFVKTPNSDYDKVKRVFEDKHELISVSDTDRVIEIISSRYEKIAFIIMDADFAKDDSFKLLEFMNDKEFLKDIPVILLTDRKNEEFEEEAYRKGVSEIIYEFAEDENINARSFRILNRFIEKSTLKQQYIGIANEYTYLNDKFNIILNLEKHNVWELDIKKGELTLINNVYSPEMSRLSKRIHKGKVVIENFPDILSESKMVDSAYFVEIKNLINNVYTFNERKYAEIPLVAGRNKEVWIGFWAEPIINDSGKIEKIVGTYKVVTDKREKILNDIKKFNISDFAKIKAVRELMVNLSRDCIVDLDEVATRQWAGRIGNSEVKYSDIVNYVYKNQVSSEYKKRYYDFMNPNAFLAKYNGEPVSEYIEYQFYQRGGVKTLRCHAYITEIDTSGDVYAFLKYVDAEYEK